MARVSTGLLYALILLTATKVSMKLVVRSDAATDDDQGEVFVQQSSTLDILCIYSAVTSNCSALSWQTADGQPLPGKIEAFGNNCSSLLTIKNVSWLGKKSFHCIYQGKENRSLIVISGRKPGVIPEPAVSWVEDHMEITWQPADASTAEMFEYSCTSDGYPMVQGLIPADCGDYKINCSKVFHCRASILVLLGATYNIRITSENHFGKLVSSFNVTVPIEADDMRPRAIHELGIVSTTEIIRLTWSEVYQDFQKMISINCSGIVHHVYTTRDFYEISQRQLPSFHHCTFCVSRQRYKQGYFSCDTCVTVLTAEGIPVRSARLTACNTSSSGVTILWQLPDSKYWNGILRRQILFYYSAAGDRTLRNITIHNGNSTMFTIADITDCYYVYITICTVVGCSEKSNVLQIPSTSRSVLGFHWFSDGANTGLVIGIPLAILGVLFLIIFAFLYTRRAEGLPRLQEPQQNEENLNYLPSQEYHVLEKEETCSSM